MDRVTGGFEPAGLARKRRWARAALWFEQVWPAVWPGFGVVGAYVCFALLDGPARLPALVRVGLLGVVLLAVGLLLRRGLRRVVRPSGDAADRRLERQSGLRHRPLASLGDRPAAASAEQEVLWREHVRRLAAQVKRLRVGRPRPGLAARDGWALRGLVLVGLAACLVVAGPETVPRVVRGFLPGWPSGAAGPGVQVQAWVTPPAYTGLAPVVLRADVSERGEAEARVPAGSHLTVSVTGVGSAPSLEAGDGGVPFRGLDATSWQAERDLGASGVERVTVRRRGGSLAAWALTLIADQAPVPVFTEPPGQNVVAGRATTQSRFAWQAVDDYGVASVRVELRLKDRADAAPLLVAAPVSGSPKTARGVLAPDLTAHPWAGLGVVARLVAKDAPGQEGVSAEAEFTLPERAFEHPVARALIAVRRQLSLTPDERRPARMVVDALADQPEAVDNSTGILLNLRALSALLGRGRGREAVDEAQGRMWDLALALEEGAPERTAQALEQARQALRDAVDPNRAEPADRAEVDQRVQELRDAIQKRLEALAEEARREGVEAPFDPSLPQMNARELDRMAERLQQSLQEGRSEDAKRQMAELEKLLEQLQNARPETGQERAQRRAEQRQKGREQMDAVQDMVQREGQLLDRSESRAGGVERSENRAPGQRGPAPRRQADAVPPNSPQPDGASPGSQRAGEAKSQQAMRRALGELMQRSGDLTGEVPAPLGEADQAMREAAEALGAGQDQAAGSAARRAIEALQKGGREMGQQVARQFGTGRQPGGGQEGEGQEGEGQGDGQGEGQAGTPGGTGRRDGMSSGARPGEGSAPGQRRSMRRDPLGRPLHEGTSGTDEAGDVRVPDEMEQARTREIQEELRRRGGDRTRPRPELDYIERLLQAY